ncbi:MAG: SagB/ThcOx family dehydrogenase [Bacillota bacterium]|nr:SagB/ThcOx family dehydrogenase [Bacillota bacterium]
MIAIGKEFIEQTKYQNFSNVQDPLKEPPLEAHYDNTKSRYSLPKPEKLEFDNISLKEAIGKRRSVRKYSEVPLTMGELSYLLWSTQGVKKVVQDKVTFRNVPSAGARHALETYLLINNVEELPAGLYRYLAIEHMLVEVNFDPKISQAISEACLGQDFIKKSGATFIWVAVAPRMTWRYGERGYRYLFLDAGHVCQNLYLSAEGLGCGACAIAAYSDDELNSLLALDGKEQFVIYIGTVGKK